MPELPEVETLCRQLHDTIEGKKIIGTRLYDPKLAGLGNIKGRLVRGIRRSGKTIGIYLDDDRCVTIHLRMTGRLYWHRQAQTIPHTRWRMRFREGYLDLIDPRRFATVRIGVAPETNEGSDLTRNFNERAFLERQARRKVNIKVLLMDPQAIAGIGNIYACEILHRTGISPLQQAESIPKKKWKDLFRRGREILMRGIEKRGTSISDWRDLYGCSGENQHELAVYGREGERCPNCGGIIRRIKQGGRSTYYCPDCQK